MFSYPSIIVRWLTSMFIVFATFNPSGYSYVHWVLRDTDQPWSLKILAGILLGSFVATFFLATVRSLGLRGIVAVTGLLVAATRTLIDLGLLRDLSHGAYVTIVLVVIASILALGVSWSNLTLRVTGQVDSNDVTLR
jgi:O-antigen ligase